MFGINSWNKILSNSRCRICLVLNFMKIMIFFSFKLTFSFNGLCCLWSLRFFKVVTWSRNIFFFCLVNNFICQGLSFGFIKLSRYWSLKLFNLIGAWTWNISCDQIKIIQIVFLFWFWFCWLCSIMMPCFNILSRHLILYWLPIIIFSV